jgi:carbonic anhydrase/acetyltransferase-like protein (isoleucine patch superfamily)
MGHGSMAWGNVNWLHQKAEVAYTTVGRSDMNEGWMPKESHVQETSHLNATSKSQASNKQDPFSLLSTNLV